MPRRITAGTAGTATCFKIGKNRFFARKIPFLELVRYIHLNPLRAGLVKDLAQLDKYLFSGHGVIMGRRLQDWQNSEAVLACFGKRKQTARSGYRAFVAKGIDHGKRPDLTVAD